VKVGDVVKIAWDPGDYYVVRVVEHDRGFFVLENFAGERSVCHPDSLCYTEILPEMPDFSQGKLEFKEFTLEVADNGVGIYINNQDSSIFFNTTYGENNQRIEVKSMIDLLGKALDAHT